MDRNKSEIKFRSYIELNSLNEKMMCIALEYGDELPLNKVMNIYREIVYSAYNKFNINCLMEQPFGQAYAFVAANFKNRLIEEN